MSEATPGIVTSTIANAELVATPIPPEDIISGEPVSSMSLVWRSEDNTHYVGIWSCTPGVFTLSHPAETITCIEGHATITPEGGVPVTVRAGDLAFIPGGTTAQWEVHETIRKSFHSHDATGTMIADF
jgi:uncharacterized protein